MTHLPNWMQEFATYESGRVALRHGSSEMTYGELWSSVERMASHLHRIGVPCGGTVVLVLDRSFDWIIAACAVMRAGAAYVPTDPAWPAERLKYVITDSGASAVIAHEAEVAQLDLGLTLVDPVRDRAALLYASILVAEPIAPQDLAYLIYTSGSTGVPKGVEITHANLAHLIAWHRDAFAVTIEDRASHLAGLAFDAAGWEIWPYLAAGASLSLADEIVRTSPELLHRWMVSEQITIGFVPSALAGALVTMDWPESTSLRLLLTGGDTLTVSPNKGLPFTLINNYGPTECTVVATSGVIPPALSTLPTIGRAISGAVVYVLDHNQEPVPAGCEGEIYIGGGGVGRGYRNLPDLTAQAFLADPFSSESDARMYRTGDLGVVLPDQQISFRGRADRQEKIRGQRVELDEIACVLNQHAGVAFGAVALRPASGSNLTQDRLLAAYVLPESSSPLSVSELQEFLSQTLPAYMVPSQFVRLDAVPLTVNGKLNYAELALRTEALEPPRRAARTDLSPIEEKLVHTVRELLVTEDIFVEDDFFLVGGHSLLGTQLVLRIRAAFGVHLTLRDLFESATVERLSEKVESLLIAQLNALSEEEVAGQWKS